MDTTSDGCSKVVQDYKNYLELRGYSNRTISLYTMFAKLFWDRSYNNVNQEGVDYFCHEHNYHLSRAFLINFFGFLGAKKLNKGVYEVKGNKIDIPLFIRKRKKLPGFFDKETIDKLISNAPDSRMELALSLLFDTGLRASELCAIKVWDIDFKTNTIKGVGKGGVSFNVIFTNKTKLILNQYIKNYTGDDKVFNIGARRLWELTKEYGKKQGVKLHPHKLRHSLATHLLNNGVDIVTIKEILRHRNIGTTEIYVHITQIQARERYKKVMEG